MRPVTQKSFTSLGVALSLALMGLALPPRASGEVISNVKTPMVLGVPIPCSGDFVLLSGNLHTLVTREVDNNGGEHVTVHNQRQGFSGVSVNGVKYQGTGGSHTHENNQSGPSFEGTFVDNFRIIGQGKGNNLLMHLTIHLTVNANGDVTAEVLNFNADCK